MSQDCWTNYEYALDHARVLFVYGNPGIGKTYLSYHYGMKGRELFAMTLGEEASSVELRGHYISKGGDVGTVWHDGPLTRAVRKAKARFVINEISNASPDILGMLYAILEDPSTAKLTLPTGETLSVSEGFQCVFTDNNDPARSLPDALRDRVEAFVRCDKPHPEALKVIIEPLRGYAYNAVVSGVSGLRSWMHFSKYLQAGVQVDVASELAFGEMNEMLNSAVVDATEKWNETPESVKYLKSEPQASAPASPEPEPSKPTYSVARGSDGILRVVRPANAPK